MSKKKHVIVGLFCQRDLRSGGTINCCHPMDGLCCEVCILAYMTESRHELFYKRDVCTKAKKRRITRARTK